MFLSIQDKSEKSRTRKDGHRQRYFQMTLSKFLTFADYTAIAAMMSVLSPESLGIGIFSPCRLTRNRASPSQYITRQ